MKLMAGYLMTNQRLKNELLKKSNMTLAIINNKLILCAILVIVYGCSSFGNSSLLKSSGCPEKPITALSEKDVKEISLNEQTISESSQATATKSVGYKFKAQSGQKLSYQTEDDICVWIYTPDNQLISDGNLPQTGTYIVQVSAPKGSKTFDLQMTLGTLKAASSSSSSSPAAPKPSTQNSTPSSRSTQASDLTKDQALEIVKNWYSAKPKIFGPPFDRSLVDQLATGEFHYNKTKSDGSIAWLKNNNSYYTYRKSEIIQLVSFVNSPSRPSLTVNVSEDLTLHTPKGIDRSASGSFTSKFTYFFTKENGVWKISDSKKNQ